MVKAHLQVTCGILFGFVSMVLGDDGSGVERLVDGNNVSLNATVFDKCAVPNATLRICGAAGGGVFFPTNPAAEAEWPKVS